MIYKQGTAFDRFVKSITNPILKKTALKPDDSEDVVEDSDDFVDSDEGDGYHEKMYRHLRVKVSGTHESPNFSTERKVNLKYFNQQPDPAKYENWDLSPNQYYNTGSRPAPLAQSRLKLWLALVAG